MLRPTVAYCIFALGALVRRSRRCIRLCSLIFGFRGLRVGLRGRRGHRQVTVPRSDAARSACDQRLPDASLRWPDTRFVPAAVAHDPHPRGAPTRRIVFAAVATLHGLLYRRLLFRHSQHRWLPLACIVLAPRNLRFVVMIRALTMRSTGPAGTCFDLRSTSARRAG
jgi:hypothetical protein